MDSDQRGEICGETRHNTQVGGTALLRLVVVSAWDAQCDTVLAGLLRVIGVFSCTAHFAGSACVAACMWVLV